MILPQCFCFYLYCCHFLYFAFRIHQIGEINSLLGTYEKKKSLKVYFRKVLLLKLRHKEIDILINGPKRIITSSTVVEKLTRNIRITIIRC